MRWLRWPVLLVLACAAGIAIVAGVLLWPRSNGLPEPVSVPSGDQEIAWINTSSAADGWSQFVIGLKRLEPYGRVEVDVRKAFPQQSTDVPEVVIRRPTHEGQLRIRWYKTASDATLEQWVEALARRDPAPLAIIGGWSSDQAYQLATALERTTEWRGDRPLFLITQATAETLNVDTDSKLTTRLPALMDMYPGRSFRFCYTNRQMAAAVIEYVVHDLSLMPGPVGWPGFRMIGAAAAGPWNATAAMGDLAATGPAVFAVEWQDDLYSEDLAFCFKEAVQTRLTRRSDPASPTSLPSAPVLIRDCIPPIPFSVGAFSRPNVGEAGAVQEIATRLRPPGDRSLLIVPTGSSAPARRVLLALAERVPQVGRRVVAVTGDGLSLNTIYRDAEFAWPARSIPIQLVMFAHANPLGWDREDDLASGYPLRPKTSTQDVLAYHELGRVLTDATFPDSGAEGARIESHADAILHRLRERRGEPRPDAKTDGDTFFAANGDRLDPTGEHVVVLRPTFRYGVVNPTTSPDAVIEVHRRNPKTGWVLVASVTVQTSSPAKAAHGDCPK